MADLNELKPVGKLNPFAKFCCTIGNLPTSYMISLTYEEQLLWLCKYLEDTVIPAVNTNALAVKELQELYVVLKNYVDNYFENLDVQDEINNKLDEMVEDGELQQLFSNIFSDLQAQINSLANGSPLVASSTSEMTDTSKIYVNTTDGYWYYYDGTQWTQGGVYQSTQLDLDKTLNELSKAPESLTVGSRIKLLDSLTTNKFDTSLFENGNLDNDGNNSSGNYRIRSKSILYCNEDLYVLFPSGYLIGWHTFNANGTHLTWTGWSNTNFPTNFWEIKIPKNTYFKLLIRKINEDTSETLDYTTIINNSLIFTNNTLEQKLINDIENIKISSDNFINGEISNGSVQLVNKNYRICSHFIFLLPFDISIKVPSGYMCGYHKYNFNNLTWIEWSGWKTGEVNKDNGTDILNIPSNTPFRLIIRKINENTSETLNVENVIPLFKFYPSELLNYINYNYISKEQYTVEITSRQGEVNNYPENTLQGLKRAKDFGYNHVRVSFGWTSDGIAICSHDNQVSTSTLRNLDGSQITDTSLKLENLTYQYIIENYDAGIYKGSNFAGIPVPTLEAVLRQCKKLNQKIDIEYKFGYTSERLNDLLELIYEIGLQDVALYSITYSPQITQIQNSDYKIKTALIAHLTSNDVNLAIDLNVDRLDMFDNDTYNGDLVKLLHKNGIKVKVGSSYNYTTAIDFIEKYDVIECSSQINPLLLIQ